MINKLRPAILIRCDGSPQVGLGHLVRCMALAHMLKNNFSITFICKSIPSSIKQEILISGFRLNLINEETYFFKLIDRKSIVVLDGYHFDANYQKQIKARSAKLVCIDDLHDKEFVADLIINHAPGVKKEDYQAQPFTQYALCPEHALLRPAFLEQAKHKRKITQLETVMICFGGSDFKNLTEQVLRTVIGFSNFKKIIVVTGSAYSYNESLNVLMNKDNRISHYSSVDEKQMLFLMLNSDLAIVPASGTLMEVIAAGCVVISGMYTENQKFVYSNYKHSGFFIDAINFDEIDLKKAIKKSLNIKIKEQNIIDGNSGKRLLKTFLQLDLKEKVKLRKANNTDLKMTFQWANYPAIREYSFHKHFITKEEHTSWFNNKLKDTNCLYLVSELGKSRVGSIRFDLNEKGAIISYLIDPKYQGKGFGQIVMALGMEYLLDTKKKIRLSSKSLWAMS